MYILGIHGNFGRPDHDAAAALLRDSEIVAVAEEERFLRQKHATGLFPDDSIRYCLREAGIGIRDVDLIAFPRVTWQQFDERLRAFFEYKFGYFPPVVFVQHHLAHVASAYYLSGFSDALIVSIDRSGDGVSLAVYRGKDADLQLLHEERFPNSLGLFAAMMTQYLGFRSNHGEYKVMGLSAHGTPNIDLSFLLDWNGDTYTFHEEYLHREVERKYPEFPTEQLPIFNKRLEEKLPPRRLRNDPILPVHADLAASVQKRLEEMCVAIVDKYRLPTDRNLCVTGGVAHNSVMNGKIVANSGFEQVYIPASASDAGTALGAAVKAAVDNGTRFARLDSALLGPSYADSEIYDLLKRCGVAFEEVDDPAARGAELLAQGATLGWFQGRAELGPRALGSRSLLADPRTAAMKDKVNLIKRREDFRPFAPSILAEQATACFDSCCPSPFMSFTFQANARGLAEFPAATHVDGSARVQTVREADGLYYQLIRQFHQRTGASAVLNTSLNSNWEPIVHEPQNALSFFFSSETEHLLIGRFLVSKQLSKD